MKVLILRDEKYSQHDPIFSTCNFSYTITNSIQDVKLLYNEHYNVFITIGESWNELPIQPLLIKKCFSKWLHFQPSSLNTETVNHQVLSCYIANLPKRLEFRPKISAFTTSYKSGDKILRPYKSLLEQSFQDWEWVIIVDDDDEKNVFSLKDPRIRAYKRNGNSGYIGNVKNEACSLCRGQYLLELDHDDIILPDCLADLVKGFEWNKDVGFVYMNFAELYENWDNFHYGMLWGFGFGNYYREFVKNGTTGRWLYAAISCPINNVTVNDLVGMPNHPRAWRKTVLDQIGGYSESLPVADDYEVLVKTFFATKMLHIPKLGYLQFKNQGGNNYSLIRNGQIRKLQDAISLYYCNDFNNYFKDKPKTGSGYMWKSEKYVDCKVNLQKNFDHDKTILVKSIHGLSKIGERCLKTDVILILPFDFKTEELLEKMGLTDIKFLVLEGASDMEIENYFFRCYLSTSVFQIIP